MVLSIGFLYSSLRVKASYLESLVHVLKEKSRFRFALPSQVMHRPKKGIEQKGIVSDLDRVLGSQQTSVRLLAVEVAAELREPAAAPLLIQRFQQEQNPTVRSTSQEDPQAELFVRFAPCIATPVYLSSRHTLLPKLFVRFLQLLSWLLPHLLRHPTNPMDPITALPGPDT